MRLTYVSPLYPLLGLDAREVEASDLPSMEGTILSLSSYRM